MHNAEKCIVITTIFPPTPAVLAFARMEGWRLIVAGDRKTPAGWNCAGAKFLAPADQESSGYAIASILPWNHYCRKMLGYIHAIKSGAQLIVDTDDDNIPNASWGFPGFDGAYFTSPAELGFINIYKFYTDMHIWPRGFPLQLINEARANVGPSDLQQRQVTVGVWQGLADGDPDVDAIYRLTDNRPCVFRQGPPVVLGKGTISPFNSQNTAFRRELFPLLYLPAHVTFRFTDILRGLVAQPIMWLYGWHLGVTQATVVQERNPHNYLKDFESEIPCYLKGAEVVECVASVASTSQSVGGNLYLAYRELVRAKIVPEQEMSIVEAWLKDIGA
jgi:hypothetical protein